MDKLIEEIKKDPYNYIRNYYEELYPHMGSRVMSVVSLLPVSLIIPKMVTPEGKKVPCRINYLLLSPPGTAKTSLSERFSKFTYDPFQFESITDAKLSSVLTYKKRVSVIVSDIARIFSNPILNKTIENITGEEGKISRMTMNTSEEESKVDCVAYLSGTPDNLNKTITDGMLFRTTTDIIWHTEKEHAEILTKINHGVGAGKSDSREDKEEAICQYYRELLDIQEGEHEDLNRIIGYIIEKEYREMIATAIIPKLTQLFKKTNFEFPREMQQVYKYCFSHAFLNIFNRKIQDGNLIIERRDVDVAIGLSLRDISNKERVLTALMDVSTRKFRTLQDLKLWALQKKKENQPTNLTDYKLRETLLKN